MLYVCYPVATQLIWLIFQRRGDAMISVGIVGGTGYTGVELLRLLAGHPHARVHAVTSRKEAGDASSRDVPKLAGLC